MEDFVKIVKRAGSIKRDPKEKNLKRVKRAALLIGSQEYTKTLIDKDESKQKSLMFLNQINEFTIVK